MTALLGADCADLLHHLSVARLAFPVRWDHPTEGESNLAVESTVSAAVIPAGTTVALVDFHPADWLADEWRAQGEDWWLAEVTVGPGTDFVLAAGRYDAWLRVVKGTEAVILGPWRIRVR